MVTVPQLVRMDAWDANGLSLACDLEVRPGDAPAVVLQAGDLMITVDLGELIEAVQLLEGLAARSPVR